MLEEIAYSLQLFADFLACVVNFLPGDDFLGDSSAKTSIFPHNFLGRQSGRDLYVFPKYDFIAEYVWAKGPLLSVCACFDICPQVTPAELLPPAAAPSACGRPAKR